jgi:hypothetical protein
MIYEDCILNITTNGSANVALPLALNYKVFSIEKRNPSFF